jgi:hypothetical protein
MDNQTGALVQQLEARERAFEKFSFRMANPTWKREDLHERPSKRNLNKEI